MSKIDELERELAAVRQQLVVIGAALDLAKKDQDQKSFEAKLGDILVAAGERIRPGVQGQPPEVYLKSWDVDSSVLAGPGRVTRAELVGMVDGKRISIAVRIG